MTARKRKPGEGFEQYRENLKAEERAFQTRYRGWLVWASSERGTFYRNEGRRQSSTFKTGRA